MPRELVFSITRQDFDITSFRAGGPGGQNQNKRNTACRVKHRDSGAVAESRSERTFDLNRRIAWKRCVETHMFKAWHRKEIARRLGYEAAREAQVERDMSPKNLRVDVKNEAGRWVPEG